MLVQNLELSIGKKLINRIPGKMIFSDSGKSFRRQVAGQRWSFTLSFPIMTRTDFAPLQAFIIKQRGTKYQPGRKFKKSNNDTHYPTSQV